MIVNQEIKAKVEQYIRNSDQYTFKNFIQKYKLGTGMLVRASDLVIQCPFHIDESPSCSMNDSIDRYHCFSCGAHGNYINFLVEYDLKVIGKKTNYYQKLQELLQADPIMQAAIGSNSIFVKQDFSNIARERVKYKFNRGVNLPASYTEMADLMKHQKKSEEEIIAFILLMQNGMSVENIYQTLFMEETDIKSNQSYDMASLLEEV